MKCNGTEIKRLRELLRRQTIETQRAISNWEGVRKMFHEKQDEIERLTNLVNNERIVLTKYRKIPCKDCV